MLLTDIIRSIAARVLTFNGVTGLTGGGLTNLDGIATRATGSITFGANPSAGQTITINGTVFTFVAAGATGNQINIGATLILTLVQMTTVLNASVVAGVALATYSDDGATKLWAKYDNGGSNGNAFTLAASNATVSTANLAGGLDYGDASSGGVTAMVIVGGVSSWYRLVNASAATSSPNVIRPTDYDAVAHTRNWLLVSSSAGSGFPTGDGTEALPPWSFTSDPDTGLYRFGANQLAGSTGGTARWLLDATGVQVRNDGALRFSSGAIGAADEIILSRPAANKFSIMGASAGVGINTLLPLTKLTVVDTAGTSPRGILSMQFSTDANGARVGFAKARGTEATPTTVVTADVLGRLMFRGHDGANFLEMGSIEVSATGTIAATRVPTFMAFATATNAAPSVLTERLRIDEAGLSKFSGNIGFDTNTRKILFPDETSVSRIQLYTTGYEIGMDTSDTVISMGSSGSAGVTIKYGGVGGTAIARFTQTDNFVMDAGGSICFGSSGVTSPDVVLSRQAAAHLTLRQSTTAQTFSIHGTYTDPSNYERLTIRHNGSATGIVFSSDALGTGTIRPFFFYDGAFNHWNSINGTSVSFRNSFGNNSGFALTMGFSRGTRASPTDVQTTDPVATFYGEAYSGGTWFTCGAFGIVVNGAFISGQRPPSKLQFSTNQANAALSAKVEIDSAGAVTLTATQPLQWGSSGLATPDLFLYRGAAGLIGFGGTSNAFPGLLRNAAVLECKLADNSAFANFKCLGLTVTAPATLKGYTVATLPAGTQGMIAFATDLLTPTFLTTAVGGGSVVGLVFYDGTNWKTV
jgi:hypothetical protein